MRPLPACPKGSGGCRGGTRVLLDLFRVVVVVVDVVYLVIITPLFSGPKDAITNGKKKYADFS